MPEHPTLLMHLHGSRGFCWNEALFKTRWIELAEEFGLLVVFGQATGEVAEPHPHPIYGGISFGERYWEVRDGIQGFKNDLGYLQSIIALMKSTYGCSETIIAGHSNGGVFSCLLAVYLKHELSGLYSSMGGIGWDPHFQIDFNRCLERTSNTPRFYFYSAQFDEHLKPSKIAYDLFTEEGYPCKLEVMP